MGELEELQKDDDRYADYEKAQAHYCESCPLPKLVLVYEEGFQILRTQLAELKEILKILSERIDTIDLGDKRTG